MSFNQSTPIFAASASLFALGLDPNSSFSLINLILLIGTAVAFLNIIYLKNKNIK